MEDRSERTFALVRRLQEAGVEAEAIRGLLRRHAPSTDKYGARLEAEVDRILGKPLQTVKPVGHVPDLSTPTEAPRPRSLDDVVETFRRWFHLPDPGALLAVLGAVVANRGCQGDPVWILIVAPPGWGKTEVLAPLAGLADVHPVATLTEAALLSGVPGRDKARGAKGGLLREIGDFGIVVCKDFGSVLSMNRDARAGALAALREVYDGAWTRHVGTDGGKTLHWSGKLGLIAGCTAVIDSHHAVMGAMGDRLVFYGLPEVDPEAQMRSGLGSMGAEVDMQRLARGRQRTARGRPGPGGRALVGGGDGPADRAGHLRLPRALGGRAGSGESRT